MYGGLWVIWAPQRSGGLENINLSAKYFYTQITQKETSVIGSLFFSTRSVDMDLIAIDQSRPQSDLQIQQNSLSCNC